MKSRLGEKTITFDEKAFMDEGWGMEYLLMLQPLLHPLVVKKMQATALLKSKAVPAQKPIFQSPFLKL